MLDSATIEAFADYLKETANGDVRAAHNTSGDGEQRGKYCGRFVGNSARGEDAGRSVWWGRPRGQRIFRYILVAKSFVNGLSAWEMIPDAERRACTFVVSTGGSDITNDGIKKLQKLIALVCRSLLGDKAQTIYLVDATDQVDETQAERRSTTLRDLAQRADLQYHRYAPDYDGLDWNDTLLTKKLSNTRSEAQQTTGDSVAEQEFASREDGLVTSSADESLVIEDAPENVVVENPLENTAQEENLEDNSEGRDQPPRVQRRR